MSSRVQKVNRHQNRILSLENRTSNHDAHLTDIIEDPTEEQDDSPQHSGTKKLSFEVSRTNSLPKEDLPLPVLPKEIPEFESFLVSLPSSVYKQFIQTAIRRGVLQEKLMKPREYYSKYIDRRPKLQIITPRKHLSVENPPTDHFENFIDVKEYKYTSESRRSSVFSRNSSKKMKRPRRINQQFLDKHDETLQNIFRMAASKSGERQKEPCITHEALRNFLKERYCPEMAEVFCKVFTMNQFLGLDQYVYDLDRLILTQEDRILRLCFELYDLNKDRYICYNDLFQAVMSKKDGNFDDDIAQIRNMCIKKAKGKVFPFKIRAKSKKLNFANPSADEDRAKIPHTNPSKPEAITYEDFYRVKFKKRPQIFNDFFKYMTGKDLDERPPSPVIIRRHSLDAVQKIMDSIIARQHYKGDCEYPYYLELEQAASLYSPLQLSVLSEKFDMLYCSQYKHIRAISLQSLGKNWRKIFGACCPYLEYTFFRLLSAPDNRDITRAKFLSNVNVFVNENNDQARKKAVFQLYDKRNDGIITADEIYEFYKDIPEKSNIYQECSLIIDKFLLSIFGKTYKPFHGVDFELFCNMIPNSVLYEEFRNALINDTNIPYKNSAFGETQNVLEEDVVIRREKTKMFESKSIR